MLSEVNKSVSRQFIWRIKCDNSNAPYVLVLWKQPSFKQTSETVGAKRRITKIIITQWSPGSWAGNSKCPTPVRAETVEAQRGSECMTHGRTKMPSTSHIRDWNAVVRQVPRSLCMKAVAPSTRLRDIPPPKLMRTHRKKHTQTQAASDFIFCPMHCIALDRQ